MLYLRLPLNRNRKPQVFKLKKKIVEMMNSYCRQRFTNNNNNWYNGQLKQKDGIIIAANKLL